MSGPASSLPSRVRCFVVDAFTSRRFAGNPAAVVPLAAWPRDSVLQDIAREMNLSETAFFVPEGDGFRLRWMTPSVEVDLCGHATLATAFVIFTRLEPTRAAVAFTTRSGVLGVAREGDTLRMDFPSRPAAEVGRDEALARALGAEPASLLRGPTGNLVAVFERASQVRALAPDPTRVAALAGVGAVSVTAPGGEGEDADADFVSRFFAPAKGIPEDPVTGSAHCTLAPYWAARLGKQVLRAKQVGPRGGELTCALRGDRVTLGGGAVLVLEGELHLD